MPSSGGYKFLVSYCSFVYRQNWSSLRGLRGMCNPWRWSLDAETCRGNLMGTIKKAYNTLEHLLVILHRIRKNARYNCQGGSHLFLGGRLRSYMLRILLSVWNTNFRIYFNTRTVHLLVLCTMTNKYTIISQIINSYMLNWQGIDYMLPEDDTIVSKHVGVC
jgi:hypothetical protein